MSGVMQLADAERPTKRPPPRLESLKIRKEQELTRKEDIDEKMRQVEERRKVTETKSITLFFFFLFSNTKNECKDEIINIYTYKIK